MIKSLFKNIHPLAILAAIGAFLFVIGGIVALASTIPEILMWVGGFIMFMAGMAAIDDV